MPHSVRRGVSLLLVTARPMGLHSSCCLCILSDREGQRYVKFSKGQARQAWRSVSGSMYTVEA
jgi:hypothetical protein